MKKILPWTLLLALSACAVTGHHPTVYKDPETGLYGYQGANGVVVIPAEYTSVKPFNEFGTAEVFSPDTGWVWVDRFGSVVKSDTG